MRLPISSRQGQAPNGRPSASEIRRHVLVSIALPLATATFLLAGATGCAEEVVAHQQEEREANRIIHLLRSEGIPEAKKMRDEASRDLRFNIFVPATRATDAFGLLESHNLPEQKKADTCAVFQEGGGMIPTNTQEKAKRECGVQGDIINGLVKADDRILRVSAVVSIPDEDPLRDINEARPRPKAAVIVQYLQDKSDQPPLSENEVRAFVQARLPEMRAEDVAVRLMPAGRDSSAAQAEAGAAGPIINPLTACAKTRVIGIEVCDGNGRKVLNVIVGSVIVAGVLAAMAIFAVLRAMRYRKDLTRLTAQFERAKTGAR